MEKLLRWSMKAGLIALVIVALWFLFGPLTRWIAGSDVDGLDAARRLDALNPIRGYLTTVLGTVSVGTGLVFAARRFWLEREKQVTDSFNAAIDHLGSDSATVRAGGISALERILRYSPVDRNRVLSTVASYLREHTRGSTVHGHLSADVAAAVATLRQPRRPEPRHPDLPLDLRGVRLPGVDLRGIQLAGADLTDAELTGVDLRSANLVGATLTGTTLINADLRGANLTGTDLTTTRLTDARMPEPPADERR